MKGVNVQEYNNAMFSIRRTVFNSILLNFDLISSLSLTNIYFTGVKKTYKYICLYFQKRTRRFEHLDLGNWCFFYFQKREGGFLNGRSL